MKKWLVLCLLFMPVMATAAITECLGPDEELYFTSDSSCPDGYTNTTPAHKTVKKNISKKTGPLVFGLQIGMTPDEIEEVYPGSKIKSDFFIIHNQRMGVIEIDHITGSLIDGKLVSATVHFNSATHIAILTQLEEKYGKPYYKNSSLVQNAMGATFSNEVAKWKFKGDIDLRLEKYTSKITDSKISLTSKIYLDHIRKNPPKFKVKGIYLKE